MAVRVTRSNKEASFDVAIAITAAEILRGMASSVASTLNAITRDSGLNDNEYDSGETTHQFQQQ